MYYAHSVIKIDPLLVELLDQARTIPGRTVKYSAATLGKISAVAVSREDDVGLVEPKAK
jgi:hypothetical protein